MMDDARTMAYAQCCEQCRRKVMEGDVDAVVARAAPAPAACCACAQADSETVAAADDRMFKKIVYKINGNGGGGGGGALVAPPDDPMPSVIELKTDRFEELLRTELQKINEKMDDFELWRRQQENKTVERPPAPVPKCSCQRDESDSRELTKRPRPPVKKTENDDGGWPMRKKPLKKGCSKRKEALHNLLKMMSDMGDKQQIYNNTQI